MEFTTSGIMSTFKKNGVFGIHWISEFWIRDAQSLPLLKTSLLGIQGHNVLFILLSIQYVCSEQSMHSVACGWVFLLMALQSNWDESVFTPIFHADFNNDFMLSSVKMLTLHVKLWKRQSPCEGSLRKWLKIDWSLLQMPLYKCMFGNSWKYSTLIVLPQKKNFFV